MSEPSQSARRSLIAVNWPAPLSRPASFSTAFQWAGGRRDSRNGRRAESRRISRSNLPATPATSKDGCMTNHPARDGLVLRVTPVGSGRSQDVRAGVGSALRASPAFELVDAAPRWLNVAADAERLIVARETRVGSRVEAWSRRAHRCSPREREISRAPLADGFVNTHSPAPSRFRRNR